MQNEQNRPYFCYIDSVIIALVSESTANFRTFCSIDEMPRKHIKAECSNKNGWQFVTSKSDNPPNVLIIKG